jgi:hypothetical protein
MRERDEHAASVDESHTGKLTARDGQRFVSERVVNGASVPAISAVLEEDAAAISPQRRYRHAVALLEQSWGVIRQCGREGRPKHRMLD